MCKMLYLDNSKGLASGLYLCEGVFRCRHIHTVHVKTGTQTQRRPQLADQIQCFPIFSKTLPLDVERVFRGKLLHSEDIKSN